MPARGRHPQNKLTDLQLRKMPPGKYADGNGLYFWVRPKRTRQWVQRLVIQRIRRDIGLGGYPLVGLAKARGIARENRQIARAGGDPRTENPRKKGPTVRQFYPVVTENRRTNWKTAGTAASWQRGFENDIFPVIGNTLVAAVNIGDIRRIVVPHWHGRNSRGYLLRQNLEYFFDCAIAEHLRLDNPAATLKRVLPKVKAVVTHRSSLPYCEAPKALAAWQALPVNPAIKLALLFIVLTAARLGEVTGARWGEIDLPGRLWQVPAERMKGGAPHTVPLSPQALEVLERARALNPRSALIFPLVGPTGKTRQISQGALSDALRKLGKVDAKGRPIVAHGFRATFRVWTIEVAGARREVCERALAHGESDATVAAYTREADPFNDRVRLMKQWADYVLPRSAGPGGS